MLSNGHNSAICLDESIKWKTIVLPKLQGAIGFNLNYFIFPRTMTYIIFKNVVNGINNRIQLFCLVFIATKLYIYLV